MKRLDLIRALEQTGCELVRHGARHDWYRNPATGMCQAVPRHREVGERLAQKIIRTLAPAGDEPADQTDA